MKVTAPELTREQADALRSACDAFIVYGDQGGETGLHDLDDYFQRFAAEAGVELDTDWIDDLVVELIGSGHGKPTEEDTARTIVQRLDVSDVARQRRG